MTPDRFQVAYLAAFLDPRYKSLNSIDDKLRAEVLQLCKEAYLERKRKLEREKKSDPVEIKSEDTDSKMSSSTSTSSKRDAPNSIGSFFRKQMKTLEAGNSTSSTASGTNENKEQKEGKTKTGPNMNDEFDRYQHHPFIEPKLQMKPDPNDKSKLIPTRPMLLQWWFENEMIYPVLASLAREVLAIPASTAPAERVWSTAGNICVPKRAGMKETTLANLVMCHDNIERCETLLYKWAEEEKDVPEAPAFLIPTEERKESKTE
jgi:hAT family C-terminal dimerisation region